jgi:hypothetical protein
MFFFLPLVWIETGRYLLATANRHQFRTLLAAFRLYLRASWRVGTTRRRIEQVGGLAADGRKSVAALIVKAWN